MSVYESYDCVTHVVLELRGQEDTTAMCKSKRDNVEIVTNGGRGGTKISQIDRM